MGIGRHDLPTLEQLKELHPSRSEVFLGKKRGEDVIARVRRGGEGEIVYVEPKSARYVDSLTHPTEESSEESP